MTERHLDLLQINDLHGTLEPHPEVFRGRGNYNCRNCGEDGEKLLKEYES